MKDREIVDISKKSFDEFSKLLNIEIESEASIEIGDNDQKIVKINVRGDDLGSLIGFHGRTLEAIQLIFSQILNRKLEEIVRVVVDINEYRKRRHSYLEEVAKKALDEVRETGQNVELPPMNPFERRVVHMCLKDEDGIFTESLGEGDGRRVVIKKEIK